jgi:hypothetical protein
MLTNPSFEDGWYHPGDVAELQIPNGWLFWYADDPEIENPYSDDDWNQFVRPEVRVLPREHLPEEERELFILQGDHVLKLFKGRGAWYGGILQWLELEPRSTYRFTIKVYPDLVKEYIKGRKVWADDPQGRDGMLCFLVDNTVHRWNHLNPGEWNILSIEFTAPAERFQLGVDFMCPFALTNSGLFCDDWSLEQITAPRGAPRDQYTRVVNVLPNTATLEQALTVFKIAWQDGRQTVSGSYDDAGIGDLDTRIAVLWGVHPEMHDEYTQWYQRFYPGTAVQFRDLPS